MQLYDYFINRSTIWIYSTKNGYKPDQILKNHTDKKLMTSLPIGITRACAPHVCAP